MIKFYLSAFRAILGISVIVTALVACATQQEYDYNTYANLLEDEFECRKAEVSYAKKKDISIQILGDSTFMQGTSCGSIKDVLLKFTSVSKVYNNSISSGEILNDGYKGILRRYDASITSDYIVMGGGGVDLWKCGEKVQCHNKTASLMQDKIANFVIQNNINPESIVFINHSRVSNNAPSSLRLATVTGANEIRRMYQALESRFKGSIFVDFTKLTGVNDSTMWKSDGYHPTTEAYKRLIVQLLHSGRF